MQGIRLEKYGAGWWTYLHTIAAKGTHQQFLAAVYSTRDMFPCEDCRRHFNDLIVAYPPEHYTDQNAEGNSPFRWVWFIHNQVNRRLGKHQMSWDEAKKLYSVVCESCHLKSGSQPPPTNPLYGRYNVTPGRRR